MGNKQMEMCSFREEQDDESSKKDIIHVPIGQLHDFRHSRRHMMFSGSDRKRETDSRIGSKKAISDGVNVSVVMEL